MVPNFRYESAASSSALITQARHRSNLNVCLTALDTAAGKNYRQSCARRPCFCEKLLNARMEIVEYVTSDIVLAAEELRLAASALGRITGKVDVEQVLDALFSTFCIGK